MIRILILLAFLLSSVDAFAQSPSPQDLFPPEKPFAFRQSYFLGMTADEFRKVKFPDPVKTKIIVACSGDPIAKHLVGTASDTITEIVKKFGISYCNYYEPMNGTKLLVEHSPALDGDSGVEFKFIKSDEKDQPRLAIITVLFSQSRFADYISAYISKYGKPNKVEVEQLQNGFGAKFSSQKMTWNNSTGAIYLVQRHEKLDRSQIVYMHRTLAPILLQRLLNSNDLSGKI